MRIGVYGATGTLGRMVTGRLRALGVDVLAIGRALAPADNLPALTRTFSACHVIVNCAPWHAVGDRIARGALAARAHYVDAAGRQSFIGSLFDALHEEAVTAGTAIVPALGFDYAVGDCLARLAADAHEPATEVLVAYSIRGADVRRNSADAATTGPAGREVVYRDKRWQSAPIELDRASFEFPAPIGRRQMSRYGSGEAITVPRHVDTCSVRTLITSESLYPYPALLPISPVLRPLISMARRTPLAGLLRVAARLVPSTDTAAGNVARADRSFMVVAEVRGLDGSCGRAIATGGDFYRITAALLATGAVWIVRTQTGGVLSPAMAFEPSALLQSLVGENVQVSVEGRGRP